MKKTYLFCVAFALTLLFSLSGSAQNTVQLSGICILEDVTLDENGILDGKVWYTGSGTVLGFPGVAIDLYWDASFSRWFLAFDGQPYFENSSDTELPPTTTSGGWIETVDNIECEEDPETPLVVEGDGTQGPTDTDGDGTPDATDGCPLDSTKIAPGACGCGVADTDTDGDGTPNCNDACPNDPNKIASGACGCGVADTDTDGDGTPNCNDACPNDPNKIAAGACGCGVPDTDTDNDGTPDCNDECPTVAGQTINLPFSYDGVGEFCWITDGNINFINSWNLQLLEINGVAYTNTWTTSMPPRINGKYYIRYKSIYPWGHFEVQGVNPSPNNACSNPVTINVPFSKDGVGEFCWSTSGNISYVNSWNLTSLIINGVNYTNQWSSSLPAKIGGKYYISYSTQLPWGHFEAGGSSFDAPGEAYQFRAPNNNLQQAKLYPNPTSGEAWLDLNNFAGSNCLVHVTDARGALLRQFNTNEEGGHLLRLDLHGLPSGLYFVQIKPQNATIQVIKLMVEPK